MKKIYIILYVILLISLETAFGEIVLPPGGGAGEEDTDTMDFQGYNNTIMSDTKWFNTEDLSGKTVSGIFLYVLLFLIFIGILGYSEYSKIPICFFIAGIMLSFISLLFYTLISAIIGVIFFVFSFFIMVRGGVISRSSY